MGRGEGGGRCEGSAPPACRPAAPCPPTCEDDVGDGAVAAAVAQVLPVEDVGVVGALGWGVAQGPQLLGEAAAVAGGAFPHPKLLELQGEEGLWGRIPAPPRHPQHPRSTHAAQAEVAQGLSQLLLRLQGGVRLVLGGIRALRGPARRHRWRRGPRRRGGGQCRLRGGLHGLVQGFLARLGWQEQAGLAVGVRREPLVSRQLAGVQGHPLRRERREGGSACSHPGARQDPAPLLSAPVPPSPPAPGATPSTGSRSGRPRRSRISAPAGQHPASKPCTQHPPRAGLPAPEREARVGEPRLGHAVSPPIPNHTELPPSREGSAGWDGGRGASLACGGG